MRRCCKHSNRFCVISPLSKNQGMAPRSQCSPPARGRACLNPSPPHLQVQSCADAAVRPASLLPLRERGRARGSRPAPIRDSGFALPEALLAVLLFMFILLMLYGALFSAGNYQRTSEVRLRHNDDKRFIQSFLRRQLEQTVPMIGVDDGNPQVLFRGHQRTLRFVGPLPSYQRDDGLYLQELSLADDELVLSYHPLTRAPDLFTENGLAGAEQVSLAQPVEQLELAYFGRHTADGAPAWGDAWDNPEWLPSLLRVEVVPSQQEVWPPLVIALRAQAEWRPPQLALYLE